MNEVQSKSGAKKALQFTAFLLVCAAVGYAFGSYLGRTLGEAGPDIDLDVSALVAGAIAAIYLFMAVIVAFGTILPKLGKRFLNTYDEDELRDDRRKLLASGGAMAGFGMALLVLVLASVGSIAPITAAIAFFGLMIASLGFYWPLMRAMDELDWQMSNEAVSYTYYAMLLIGGSWAALGHLELVQGPAMLDWLSMFWGLMLVASFIAAGRRGLLDKS